LIGLALLCIASGLLRRIRVAYGMTLALLAGGMVTCLLKGFDWEEAVFLDVSSLSWFLPVPVLPKGGIVVL
jgi:phosphatidylglycerol lysyltransferase